MKLIRIWFCLRSTNGQVVFGEFFFFFFFSEVILCPVGKERGGYSQGFCLAEGSPPNVDTWMCTRYIQNERIDLEVGRASSEAYHGRWNRLKYRIDPRTKNHSWWVRLWGRCQIQLTLESASSRHGVLTKRGKSDYHVWKTVSCYGGATASGGRKGPREGPRGLITWWVVSPAYERNIGIRAQLIPGLEWNNSLVLGSLLPVFDH